MRIDCCYCQDPANDNRPVCAAAADASTKANCICASQKKGPVCLPADLQGSPPNAPGGRICRRKKQGDKPKECRGKECENRIQKAVESAIHKLLQKKNAATDDEKKKQEAETREQERRMELEEVK